MITNKFNVLGSNYYRAEYKGMFGYGKTFFEAINQLLGRIY